MATQRLRGDARPANSIAQIVSFLGARRRELRASVAERLRLLDARSSAAAPADIAERLARLEGNLERLERAQSQRSERRRERIVRLRQQLEVLRGPRAHTSRMYQLGSLLIFVGSLAVLWVVLLEVGLALGL